MTIALVDKLDTKIKVKRAKGIGGVLQKQMKSLETNEKFLELYSDINLTFLLNATDTSHAAILIIKQGKIFIESINNEDKKSLKKKVLNWDSMLATSTMLFLDIAMGKLSVGKMGKKIVARKMSAKGLKNLMVLKKIFALL